MVSVYWGVEKGHGVSLNGETLRRGSRVVRKRSLKAAPEGGAYRLDRIDLFDRPHHARSSTV
jgi:hypothetical protein